MDFAIPDNGGGNAAAVRAMRGADPLLTLPPGHILHRVAGVPFQAAPGGAALHFNAVSASIVEAVLMGAAFFDGRLSGAAMSAPVLLVMVRPAKLDAIMSQLYAEPVGIGLDNHRLYENLSDAAADVCAVASRLDVSRLNPAYVITPADLIDLDPITQGAGRRLTDLCRGINALTFRDLVGGEAGFATHAAFLYYCGIGRCLAVVRDAHGSAVRKALGLLEEMAERAGCLARGSSLTGVSVVAWLNATTLPAGLQLLREHGAGASRREQLVLDRHTLFYGDEEQRERLVIGLVAYSPLKERVPNLLKVIGRGGPEADIRSCVQRLAQHLMGKGSLSVVKVSILESLEAELKPLMHALASPTTALIRMDERVALVAKAKREASGAGPAGCLGDDKATSGASQVVSRIKVDVFAEALSETFGTEAWSSFIQQTSAELDRAPLSRLRVYDVLIKSPFLGVRRAALGYQDTASAPLLRASPGLTRALLEVANWGTLLSNYLVCDLTTMSLSNQHLQRFRLDPRVVKVLKRGSFNELDWVADILQPVMSVRQPGVDIAEFSDGLWDSRVHGLIAPLLRRLSLALGLPVEPSTAHDDLSLRHDGRVVVTLCSLAATISAEATDIYSHPSPFDEDYLKQLALFEATAWSEVAELFHSEIVTARNPVGAPLVSILPDESAAFGILSVMRANKTRRREDAYLQETLYALQEDYRRGELGGRFSVSRSKVSHKSSPAKTRDRSRSPSLERGVKKEGEPTRSRHAPSENPCRHSPDRSMFWFAAQDTGRRVSPVYDYETLEKLGGRSREEVCYPFLLSSKPPHRRMSICERPDEAGHRTFTSTAHVPPTADFLEQVHRHFARPMGEGPNSIGIRKGSSSRVKTEGEEGHRVGMWSPHPADSRRSHGPKERDRSRSRSPNSRAAASRSQSPLVGGGRKGLASGDRSSRSASPEGGQGSQFGANPRFGSKQAGLPPAPRSTSPSPHPPTSPTATSKEGSSSPSSRAKRQRTPGVRRVVWGAAALAAPASANAMANSESLARSGTVPRYPLVDVSLPCVAAVRTLLFVVSLAQPDESRFYLPDSHSSEVIGSVSPLGAPRSAAVVEARQLARALPLAAVCESLRCLPVFESIPAADDVMAVVDRVVAMPVPSSVGVHASTHTDGQSGEWSWVKLGAISCAAVYALAAAVTARLASFSCSLPPRMMRVLSEMSSRTRSGARPAKMVKRGHQREGVEPAAADGHRLDAVSAAWVEVIVRMRAADEALKSALLAIPGDDPMASELHAFADVVRPIDLSEVPPQILLARAPPDYSSHQLRMLPFSTRVGPPSTLPLARARQLRLPPPDFKPRTLHDLIRPNWVKRMERWYHDLGEWLVRLAEVAHAPDSPEAEEVRRARPHTLVVPRSGFVDEAVDVVWDLTGNHPVPLDFDSPLQTHLNLQLIQSWRQEWPDYPDKEIFSHLLDGVRFKVELPYQMVLQPHLASLSHGFVNVHKELVRLIEKGYFSITPHPPFVPWRTLPSGSVERKHEPGRPRRTEDGSAPRKGTGRAEFMVDADGVRTLSINLAASIPADDLQRGTHAVFYDAWERRLAGRYSPRVQRCRRKMVRVDSGRRAVLLLFSGAGDAHDSLAAWLRSRGLDVIEVDTLVGGLEHDMTRPEVQHRVRELVRSGGVGFVFAAPPCESGSIAPADSRPRLRSPEQPWGVLPIPKQWEAYLAKHNTLIRATAECVCEASRVGVPWMIENPALRTDPELAGYWPRFRNWGTLWHCFAELGIAPKHRSRPGVRTALPTSVYETLVSACAFGAAYQKFTMLWSCGGCAPLRRRLEGRLCQHSSHSQLAHGVDEVGHSRARAAAKYPAEMAELLADGIRAVVTHELPAEGSSADVCADLPVQPQRRRCGRCKRALIQCDRCRQWCCDTTGCFYVKCICDFPEYTGAAAVGRHDMELLARSQPQGVWSTREPRVTCSDRPAPPALRVGTLTVDVNITLESSTPALANPFLMGKMGKEESLRELAAATYASFLAHRTLKAGSCSNGLRVATRLRSLTGDMVLREVERVVARHPSFARFHLVCRRSCAGKTCHGRSLCRLFDEVIQSTQSLPFPKEVKPTIPEVLLDLAVLHYLSHHTGIPVVQIVSDVKDFFNQHALAPSEKPKVGLVTVDPRAIVEYVAELRAACPELCSVLAHVLGYGLTPASNVCQRTAHLLTFVWMARMEVAARSIVAALAKQHPFIARWLADRRRKFGSAAPNEYARITNNQARLWTVSMYTDDGHQALLGPQLAVCGLRVWREITGSLKLQMAIIQKHGLGQQVTVQGVVVNTGLGVAYVPPDKLRRALSALQATLDGRLSLADYRSLVGLLQSLLFVAGMSKSSMYGLYAPLEAGSDPEDLVKLSPWLRDQLLKWRHRLRVKAGSSFWCALPRLRGSEQDVLDSAPAVFFVRSDASKEGVGAAGLGGALGGVYWRYPERGPLSRRHLELPIAALEFIAYVGSVVAFAAMIPDEAFLVSEVDALATADSLTAEAAKSPVMQAIHLELLRTPEFARIADRHVVAHIYGEANVVADAVSRDLDEVLRALASQLGLRLQRVQAPACVPALLDKALGVAELASTSLGMHNPTMTGTPFAQATSVRAPWRGTSDRNHGARVFKSAIGLGCGCVTGSCAKPAKYFDVEENRVSGCESCEVGGVELPRCDCNCGNCRPWLSLTKRAERVREHAGSDDGEGGGRTRGLDAADVGMNQDGGGAGVAAAGELAEVAACEPCDGDGEGQARRCDCVAGQCTRSAVEKDTSCGDFAFCAQCSVKGCICDCGGCHSDEAMESALGRPTRPPCMCPSGACLEWAVYFEPEIQRPLCEPCGLLSDEGLVCTCDCGGCEPSQPARRPLGRRAEEEGRPMCACARRFACVYQVSSEGRELCDDCEEGCSSGEGCACPCVGCRFEDHVKDRVREVLRTPMQEAKEAPTEESQPGRGELPEAEEVAADQAGWRSEAVRSVVWRGQADWLGRPEQGSPWQRRSGRIIGVQTESRDPARRQESQVAGRPEIATSGRRLQPSSALLGSESGPGRESTSEMVGSRRGRVMPECVCGVRLELCRECESPRCNTPSCLFIKCLCALVTHGTPGPRSPGRGGGAGGGTGAGGDGESAARVVAPTKRKKTSGSPGPAADGLVAEAVSGMLATDASEFALHPTGAGLGDLCRGLYDTSTAQPARTSQAQASAWEYWSEWCAHNGTNPWRLVTPTLEVERQREAVLMAGFLRFCHRRQSQRPRGGRPAALVTSAAKALSHIKKLHKEKGFPMPDSALVLAETRRLQLEYKAAHGVEPMQPHRKEPFTRRLLIDMLLLAPDRADLGGGFELCWDSRFGRSFAGLVTTLVQTGFRKGEVTADKQCEVCPVQCLSRSAVAWFLGGQMFGGGEAPAALLLRPRPGDYVVLTPGPSKSDQLGLVWGGTPIWIPFVADEPLCAFPALAQIEVRDACADRSSTALFTYDDGTPLVSGHMDRVLHRLLSRELPEKTVRLYSWHSARIFLATALRASGASIDETQALCRWQTPASLRIYARMNRERYGALIAKAMKVEISSARAGALADALPFLDLNESGPVPEDRRPGGDDGVKEGAEASGPSGPPGQAGQRQALPAAGKNVRSPARTRKCAREKAAKGSSGGAKGAKAKTEKRASSPAARGGAELHKETAEARYGRVPYFPEDMAGYQTFFERPSARRQPNARRGEERPVGPDQRP